MSIAIRQVVDGIVKYWVLILAVIAAIVWISQFATQLTQIQVDALALRVRITEIEQHQTRTDDRLNSVDKAVTSRLARIEALLEDIKARNK